MSENTITQTRTETIEGAKELARIFRKKNTPLYMHSAPGIGKSDVMRQLSAEDESGFIDIRVGTMLPEDLTGIPVPDLERKVAVWLRANFWPTVERDGPRGIIAFDELSDANRQLQSCVYRVILDRQIGDFTLPEGWWPVAAGNRREDRAAASSLSTALANRFAHVHIRADADCWTAWANLNNIDPMLIGFIKYRPNMIHKMEGGELAFPSPRSWAQASKYFDAPVDLRLRLVAANVGEGAAIEVETYFKLADLPDLEEILSHPTKAAIPEEPAARYALSSLLSRKMTKDTFPAILKYINRQDYGADFGTVTVLDGTKRDPDLCDTESFKSWARNNKSLKI